MNIGNCNNYITLTIIVFLLVDLVFDCTSVIASASRLFYTLVLDKVLHDHRENPVPLLF